MTLQKYFVLNSSSSDFIALDIAPSILTIDKGTLTNEEKAAIASFKKMNILAFKKDSINEIKYTDEVSKVKKILKVDEYQELMKFGANNNGAAVYFVGDTDRIDEFVVYANQKENGFVVVRILGNDMNTNHVMALFQLLQKSKIDLEQFKPLQQIIK